MLVQVELVGSTCVMLEGTAKRVRTSKRDGELVVRDFLSIDKESSGILLENRNLAPENQ